MCDDCIKSWNRVESCGLQLVSAKLAGLQTGEERWGNCMKAGACTLVLQWLWQIYETVVKDGGNLCVLVCAGWLYLDQLLSLCRLCAGWIWPDAGAAVWADPSLAGLCVVVVKAVVERVLVVWPSLQPARVSVSWQTHQEHFIPDNLFLCVLPVCGLCDENDQ